ncbi:MAG: hypothetical protein ABJD68_17085, partial [Nakamurella sp.]
MGQTALVHPAEEPLVVERGPRGAGQVVPVGCGRELGQRVVAGPCGPGAHGCWATARRCWAQAVQVPVAAGQQHVVAAVKPVGDLLDRGRLIR